MKMKSQIFRCKKEAMKLVIKLLNRGKEAHLLTTYFIIQRK